MKVRRTRSIYPRPIRGPTRLRNGHQLGDGTQIVSGNPTSVAHTYADGTASYTISATATDEDGTFSANTVAVTAMMLADARD